MDYKLKIIKGNDVIKKFKLENGNKVKIFEKKDLKNKLGFSADEIKIVMRYQKDFPELLQEHTDNDYIINARVLWERLENPYNQYTHWMERKVFKKSYVENIDYISIGKKTYIENTNITRNQIDTFFTVDAAKHIAMSENSEKGREVRSYFILMERAMRDMEKWIMVRNPEKEGYNQLMDAVKSNYMLTHSGKEPHFGVYSNEGDMINVCLLGARAKEIRALLEVKDNQTRDNLTTQINKAIYELQIMDIGLLMGQLDFSQRKATLLKMCKNKYSHIYLQSNKLLSEAV
ncbi:antA/AntB antirepressor family protein [Paenibacillus sp. FSL H3-0333]|uniref:antA/AntB antirepressor family protein n=1 Tax=Paenibacillus sp. FSL H3-0333 TaxID=2921373 RepID=UPI0030FCC3CD